MKTDSLLTQPEGAEMPTLIDRQFETLGEIDAYS